MIIPLHVDCATGAILTNVSKVTKVYRSTFDYGVKNDRSQKTEKKQETLEAGKQQILQNDRIERLSCCQNGSAA